jgi:hypothetical protein
MYRKMQKSGHIGHPSDFEYLSKGVFKYVLVKIFVRADMKSN